MYTDSRGELFDRFSKIAIANPQKNVNVLLTAFILSEPSHAEFIGEHALLFMKAAEAARRNPEIFI